MLLEHLPERPVAGPAVREATAGALERLRLQRREPLPELTHEPRLAHARVAHDRDQMGLAELDPPVGRLQELELALAANERAVQAGDAARPHQRERADEPAARGTTLLPLRLDRLRLAQLEGASRGRDGALADEDLSRRRCLLEPCGDIDRVSGDEGGAFARPPHDDLARVDADPQL